MANTFPGYDRHRPDPGGAPDPAQTETMPMLSEPDLEQWFAQLYKHTYLSLLRDATIWLSACRQNSNGCAEDAVQLTYLKAWRIRHKLKGMESPTGWLRGTLLRTTKELTRENIHWQKRVRQMSEQITRGGVPDFRLKVELQSLMTAEEYMWLKRLYLDRCTYQELSQELGLTRSALAMRVKRLKDRLARHGD